MWYAPHRCEWSSLKQVESNDEILSIAGMHTYKNLYCIKLLASATLVPSAGILTIQRNDQCRWPDTDIGLPK